MTFEQKLDALLGEMRSIILGAERSGQFPLDKLAPMVRETMAFYARGDLDTHGAVRMACGLLHIALQTDEANTQGVTSKGGQG